MVYILMALIGFTVALIYFVAEAKINWFLKIIRYIYIFEQK